MAAVGPAAMPTLIVYGHTDEIVDPQRSRELHTASEPDRAHSSTADGNVDPATAVSNSDPRRRMLPLRKPLFPSSVVATHDGGHLIPTDLGVRKVTREFLTQAAAGLLSRDS